LRERKYRKERPFALMARNLAAAERIVELSAASRSLLTSIARPIVLAPARVAFDGVAPDNSELGVMLPYTPLQLLLFAYGAPGVLVMTSANRSSEPIAYEDTEACARLNGIADAFLIGERDIARRVDDSVVRVTPYGPAIVRHARGYAPRAVATMPVRRPMLCVGADLKNAITVVVEGQAFVSQHIGDLDHFGIVESFKNTIRDLCRMYELPGDELIVVHDAHPEYVSTAYAESLPGDHIAVQHHRAHVASVLAEREAFDLRVIGVAFDGTGYGDDATIWGGEVFDGSVSGGFQRVMSLRPAALPGGDAAARFPVQAAAGFLAQLDDLPDVTLPPFDFPDRYGNALKLVRSGVRTFTTTSVGRLFDTVAALLGFTREITFEGQAAMWLEHLAGRGTPARAYAFPVGNGQLDFRPTLRAIVADRAAGVEPTSIARAFHVALADAIVEACSAGPTLPVVASGGVFQNALLIELLSERLGQRLMLNERVPANDGGISLGQAAIAACAMRA
jgi:hydrogenase maturation protein HypF